VGDVEFAVQVVGFVEKGASQQIFARVLEEFSGQVLGSNDDDFARLTSSRKSGMLKATLGSRCRLLLDDLGD